MIDIIVVTYNRIEYFKTFIEFLYLFTDHPFRLIVVDNGSIDGTRNFILEMEKEGLVWKYVFTDENLPLALAYTEGFKLVESELFVVADDDMLPPMFKNPCWLTLIKKKILSNDDIGCVNFMITQEVYSKFANKRIDIYSRIELEGGKRLDMFKKLQKIL